MDCPGRERVRVRAVCRRQTSVDGGCEATEVSSHRVARNRSGSTTVPGDVRGQTRQPQEEGKGTGSDERQLLRWRRAGGCGPGVGEGRQTGGERDGLVGGSARGLPGALGSVQMHRAAARSNPVVLHRAVGAGRRSTPFLPPSLRAAPPCRPGATKDQIRAVVSLSVCSPARLLVERRVTALDELLRPPVSQLGVGHPESTS